MLVGSSPRLATGRGFGAAAAFDAGVEIFTFWWGSPRNLQLRSADEVEAIVGVLREWLEGEGARLLSERAADFEVHGDWRELCPQLKPGVDAALRAAAGPSAPRRIELLMGYDGRDEIREAARRLGGPGDSPEDFGRATWTGGLPPVDLLVRTGGEPHLSAGFMLWSIAEAQLAFPAVLWPDADEALLAELIESFSRTERRFGA